MPPAARVGDSHACPSGSHVGGPVRAPASTTVNIGGQPAARAGDRAACSGPLDTIAQGSPTVFIDGRPAARVGDKTTHSGLIVTGCATVNIGNAATDPGLPGAGGGGGGGTPLPGGPGGPGSPGAPGSGGSSGGATTPGSGGAAGSASNPAGAAGADAGKKTGLRLFGVPISLDTVRSIAKLAQQMIPGLATRVPPVDPAALQATLAELRAAIEARDVEGVNAITARLTAMIQNGGAPPADPASAEEPAPANTPTSPWTWKGGP